MSLFPLFVRARLVVLLTPLVAGIALVGPVGTSTSAAAAEPTVSEPAPTAPLGWNSWNTYFCDINEAKIKAAADAMVTSGMRDVGYDYVVVDDCWQATTRDANGALRGDPTRFPSGMKALGDYIHGKGLKFGIYQAPRTKTCAQYFNGLGGATGAQGHEVQDANTFASWGVDYLKYDWCDSGGTLEEQKTAFKLMGDALKATGRPIVYSINSNSAHANTGPSYDWGQIADTWRTTEDITDKWTSGCTGDCFMGVTEILDVQAGLTSWTGPGRYNDPDMLEVGVRGTFNNVENRAHFSMWAIMGAPLMAGNNITAMPEQVRQTLTNADVLAVNQDELALQATRVRDDGDAEVWAKRLANGDVAVALLNRGGTGRRITATAAEIKAPSASAYTWTDLWTKGKRSTSSLTASVPAHGVAMYRVSAGAQTRTTFQLRGQASNRCLDLTGGVANYGTTAELFDCAATAPTQELALRNGQLMVGGMCLDVDNSRTASGTQVLSWECNGQPNQQWTQGSDGTIRSTLAGRCLDAPLSGQNGNKLVIWDCNGQTNQKWTTVRS